MKYTVFGVSEEDAGGCDVLSVPGVAVAGVVLMGDVFVFLYKSSEVGDSVG